MCYFLNSVLAACARFAGGDEQFIYFIQSTFETFIIKALKRLF